MKENFGDFLREKRIAQRISSLKFAEKTGISVVELSRIENEGVSPSPRVMDAIQGLLQLSQPDLVELQELAYAIPQQTKKKPEAICVTEQTRICFALRIAKGEESMDHEWLSLCSVPAVAREVRV